MSSKDLAKEAVEQLKRAAHREPEDVTAKRHELAQSLLRHALEADDNGNGSARALYGTTLAVSYLLQGRYDEADQALDDAIALVEGKDAEQAQIRCYKAVGLALQRNDRAIDLAIEAVRPLDVRRASAAFAFCELARSLVYRVLGQHADAAGWLAARADNLSTGRKTPLQALLDIVEEGWNSHLKDKVPAAAG